MCAPIALLPAHLFHRTYPLFALALLCSHLIDSYLRVPVLNNGVHNLQLAAPPVDGSQVPSATYLPTEPTYSR
eukprot:3934020-Rhodomonas_salina.1